MYKIQRAIQQSVFHLELVFWKKDVKDHFSMVFLCLLEKEPQTPMLKKEYF